MTDRKRTPATVQPTAAEWTEIDERLKHFLEPVHLRIDGFEVWLELRQISQFRNAIFVYVNGYFKGKWFVDDTEEAKRFFPLRRINLYSPAERKRLIKAVGKRQAERSFGLSKYREQRGWNWTSFRSLKRHLVENNDCIEVVHPKEAK